MNHIGVQIILGHKAGGDIKKVKMHLTGNHLIRSALICCGVFVFLVCYGCAGSDPVKQPQEPRQNFISAGHLVFIGLDGWGAKYLPKADMPAVKSMMADGASSIDARCLMPSSSWPNWSAMFYSVSPNDTDLNKIPSLFSLLENEKPGENIVLFHEWNDAKRDYQIEISEEYKIFSGAESVNKIGLYIKENRPIFTAVVFDEPDKTGHSKCWGSEAYYKKLYELDSFISVIKKAVIDAGIYNDTVFVLSSDHGGSFKTHGSNFASHRRIPLVVFGKGIKKGYSIYGKPDILDIAPTMAAILGLNVPSEWEGQVLWEIFE